MRPSSTRCTTTKTRARRQIEALKIVQKARGWVPDGAADAIGEILGIPASDVEGVATFYSQISVSRWAATLSVYATA